MSVNPQDDIGDKATASTPGVDRNAPEDPPWDFSLLPGRPPRPAAHIRFDLELALAYKERYQHRATADRWVRVMRDDNEADIARLEAELESATDDESPESQGPSGAAALDEESLDHDLDVGKDVEAGKVVGWPRRQSGHVGPDVGL